MPVSRLFPIGALMSDPNFAVSFATANVVVARSGDLAYETGSYELQVSDPNQQALTQKGNYVVVWRKQADDAWKVAIDAPSSNP
jgi:ketosteroid isomerase-like protein